MNLRFIALTLLAGFLQTVSNPAFAEPACNLKTLQAPTKFPLSSQLRGQRGIVLIAVSVDQKGRPVEAQLVQSSGYRLLDRAARSSVLKSWVFDTTGCEGTKLPATRTVAVEYRNDQYGS